MLLLGEKRLTSDALRYGFAVGKVRVLETRMLDRAGYERLLDAPTFDEQRRLLSETAYGRYVERAETPGEVERGLDDALEGFYAYLSQAALPEQVQAFFRTRYDFANLKAALKARALGAPLEGLIVVHGSVPAESFSADLEQLPDPLGPLARELSDETDTAVIDARTDAGMYAELLRLAKAAKSAYLTRVARLLVDIGNVKNMVRGTYAGHSVATIRGLLADGGTVAVSDLASLLDEHLSELPSCLRRFPSLVHFPEVDLSDPAELDIAADAVFVSALRDGRRGPTGPEPVIAYVFAREYEVAALRVLLVGKLTGIPDDTLRARLRASYR